MEMIEEGHKRGKLCKSLNIFPSRTSYRIAAISLGYLDLICKGPKLWGLKFI
jgi:hypothetical protein